MGSVRVAIVGVGNCATSLIQGVEYYRDADPDGSVPGLMHVKFGDYHVGTSSSSPRSTSTPRRSASTCPRRSATPRTTPSRSPTCRRSASPCSAARPYDGLGKYYRETIDESDAEPVDVVAALQGGQGRRARVLPPGRLRGGRQVLRAVRHRRRRRLRQRPARLHRLRPRVGQEVRGRRRPDRRRRHQVAGGRHHHPPRDGQAVRGPRRRAGPHLPAQRRRQHGLQEHARARPPGVEEDLQDPGRDLQPRARPRRAQRAHRSLGLRRLARRPQVGLRPPRGSRVRRRPAQHGVQARGVGLPQQRRHHHRRDPRLQDRPRPGHRRPDHLGVDVPDEVPARCRWPTTWAAPGSRRSSAATWSADPHRRSPVGGLRPRSAPRP